MTHPTTFLRNCLLGAVLAAGAFGAAAAPLNYHVDVNSAAYSGTDGLLDLYFSSFSAASPAVTVTVSHLAGASLGTDTGGAITDLGNGKYLLGNTYGQDNYLDLITTFGGHYSFDLAFVDAPSADGSTLSLSLLAPDLSPLNNAGGVAVFNFGSPGGMAPDLGVSGVATVSVIPEPSALLLLLSGFGLMGFVARRRAAR